MYKCIQKYEEIQCTRMQKTTYCKPEQQMVCENEQSVQNKQANQLISENKKKKLL